MDASINDLLILIGKQQVVIEYQSQLLNAKGLEAQKPSDSGSKAPSQAEQAGTGGGTDSVPGTQKAT